MTQIPIVLLVFIMKYDIFIYGKYFKNTYLLKFDGVEINVASIFTE